MVDARAATPRKTRARAGERFGFVVVANRLPLRPVANGNAPAWQPSPGGLVSALSSVLRSRHGLWIGWPGAAEYAPLPERYDGIALRTVDISPEEYEEFYLGFSNATLWPLYHDAIRAPAFHRNWWQAYQRVNERYAQTIAASVAEHGTVWVHDYQLQLVPKLVRELRPDVRIGFFLHIPFPPMELFMQLPWRREIVNGVLGADLVGFQTGQAASNFSRMARRLSLATGTDAQLNVDGHSVRVEDFPISVDGDEIVALANDPKIRQRARDLRASLGNPEVILLGVDRLDYTKGIQQRMKAVGELYRDGSLRAGTHVMVQVAVPSRETNVDYERERHQLEQIVSELNGEYGLLGSPIVHYLHQNLPFDELVALYLAADVMIVTPFRDGMNLVAKEYVMCRIHLSGRLVLSEFAGASAELRGAFVVNPHDLEGVKEAIRLAVNAGPKEVRERMSRMRRRTLRRSVYDWANGFLAVLAVDVPERRRQTTPKRSATESTTREG